ncbi:2-aminoethylphosphonate--pyruvate transaminase [Rhodovastum sp. RN2-1]|uniref:2-aminoethylphosphonate--pyruvate transaminase n=2 Tax=Limobrevibacterium gyesilva TaxID=2991712 RepID=A0AA41YI28_9PROT|nr:2-aminoethylphosphonate--pyruvate transaminase [Limobrevibacterium gyesilva]MCW3473304.1 2-aminoethylphosphonate--pyruvate transaminase [Limobrevibacterium gyesilva]
MLLLIPGPVTTRPEVRQAMTQDHAPWDNAFRPLYASVRERVLAIAGGVPGTHASLALQGCGHFATEAAVRTFVPPGGRILIPATGSYADRMARLAREAGRVVVPLTVAQTEPVSPAVVAAALAADPTISHVGLVYSETSSGVIHDAIAIGEAVRAAGRRLILDAVSAFGALPLDISAQPEMDVAVFTTNKCLEGLPGLSFAVARVDSLTGAVGNAGSWSFDLADIYAHALRSGWGSFRFTPPAQVLAAFQTALDFFDVEGGQAARLARYTANARTLYDGMLSLGLEPCLARDVQGPIVMNVHAPSDPAWSLQAFVDALKEAGFVISNFYNTEYPSFRVGCIGAVTPGDMQRFISAVDQVLVRLGIKNRSASRQAA